MEPPIPPPRRITNKEDQSDIKRNEEVVNIAESGPHSQGFQEERVGVIQVSAEIHSSNTKAAIQHEEKRPEKKKRKIKRRGTFTLKDKRPLSGKSKVAGESVQSDKSEIVPTLEVKRGSETETISDSDSGKIKLIPLRPASSRRRLPAGSATETLSEESDRNELSPTHNLPPVPPRRRSVPLTSVQTNNERPKSAAVFLQNSEKLEETETPPPVPAPRSSFNKSVEQLGSPYCTSSSMDYKDSDLLSNRLRKHKKKRKLRDSKEPDEESKKSGISSPECFTNQNSTEVTPVKEGGEKRDDEMACITVHSCEPLLLKHFNCRHFVRVHVIDLTAGKYKRSALGKMDIQPVNTIPFEYREQRLAMPTWEEDLLLLEPLSHIVSVDTLLIFEVINSQNDDIIAWAFLKPVAANGALNTGKTLRLQLYKPGRTAKDISIPKGFQWWSRAKYSNYKSTIFITLNGVPSDLIIKPSILEATDLTKAKEMQGDEVNLNSTAINEKDESDLDEVVWNRLPSLSCKLPNSFITTLDSGNSGSMALAYSSSGLYIASQVGDNLCLFTFKGKLILTMIGHQGLIYCLRWTKDDKRLLSSSADSTTCVWDIGRKRTTPLQVLPHPSYVYSCCWLDESEGLIVTACYDKCIRLWKMGSKSPLQHILKHNSPVNCVAAISNISIVSGDNLGLILFWKLSNEGKLEFERELLLREIKGKSINKLIIHSGKKRMIVHTRDSVLRMVDLATGSVVQWFRGGLNNRFRCDSCLCGCGSRVFATCEDGTTCCWDAHTGQMLAIYTQLQINNSAASIDFHPRDHYLAVASQSPQGTSSLSLIKYDREADGKEVGIIYLDLPATELGTSSQSLSSSLSASPSNPSLLKEASYSSPVTPSSELRKVRQKKDFGIFKTLLGRKKTKKGETNNGYQTTEVESNVFLVKKEKKTTSSIASNGHDTRDHRLSDIIKRMDKILTAISSTKPL